MKIDKDIILAATAIISLGAFAFFMKKEVDTTNDTLNNWQNMGYYVRSFSTWDNVHYRYMYTVHVITPTYEYFVTDFSKSEAVQAIKGMMNA